MNTPNRPSRIDFDRIDINQIDRVLKTGSLECLTESEREYYKLMDIVRGMRARIMTAGGQKITTKAGIIKNLKNLHGLSDWMARRVYDDAINFFFSSNNITPRAWANLYAERLEKISDIAIASMKFSEARAALADAARLRGCFEKAAPEIPEELLNQRTAVVYTADPVALGAPAASRAEVDSFIDSIPDIPELVSRRVKEDAGVLKKNLLKRMAEDVKEFTDTED